MQGARRGTRSWVSRIRPWAEGRHPTDGATQAPLFFYFLFFIFLFFYFLIFYLSIHDRHRGREAEIQVEGEAGFMQGARRGT